MGKHKRRRGREKEALQEKEWAILHDRIANLLDQFGKKDPVGDGDYWLVDENLGWQRHKVEIDNLNFLQPHIIKSLQALLADFPTWDITVQVAVSGKEKEWPGMGLTIYSDEIIDELQREFLPDEFRNIHYEGARPLRTDLERIKNMFG